MMEAETMKKGIVNNLAEILSFQKASNELLSFEI